MKTEGNNGRVGLASLPEIVQICGGGGTKTKSLAVGWLLVKFLAGVWLEVKSLARGLRLEVEDDVRRGVTSFTGTSSDWSLHRKRVTLLYIVDAHNSPFFDCWQCVGMTAVLSILTGSSVPETLDEENFTNPLNEYFHLARLHSLPGASLLCLLVERRLA